MANSGEVKGSLYFERDSERDWYYCEFTNTTNQERLIEIITENATKYFNSSRHGLWIELPADGPLYSLEIHFKNSKTGERHVFRPKIRKTPVLRVLATERLKPVVKELLDKGLEVERVVIV